MTTEKFEQLDGSTAIALLSVRYRALRAAGVEPEEATMVAGHPHVRLADVIDLVRRGFPAQTALRRVLDAQALVLEDATSSHVLFAFPRPAGRDAGPPKERRCGK
jgi:hypothetical protein